MNADVSMHNLAKFISEVAMLDYSLAHLPPSSVAAAAIYVSSIMLRKEFPQRMFQIVGLPEPELFELAKKFAQPIRQWTHPDAKLQSLQKKFEKL